MDKITIGRIVHVRYKARCYAAMVVDVDETGHDIDLFIPVTHRVSAVPVPPTGMFSQDEDHGSDARYIPTWHWPRHD